RLRAPAVGDRGVQEAAGELSCSPRPGTPGRGENARGLRGTEMDRYDVIVIGAGGMGSAALYHLARRGRRVLGLERYNIPHDMGSSHGITRIIRLAYYEHPSYLPLLRRAYELWRDLLDQAGGQLVFTAGLI